LDLPSFSLIRLDTRIGIKVNEIAVGDASHWSGATTGNEQQRRPR